ncbi:hypothetical protein HAX54_002155, partial [Datura stramonium]|nr:hypothetical protein [Datura stramonium]
MREATAHWRNARHGVAPAMALGQARGSLTPVCGQARHGLSPTHWQAQHDPTLALWHVRRGTGHGNNMRRCGKEDSTPKNGSPTSTRKRNLNSQREAAAHWRKARHGTVAAMTLDQARGSLTPARGQARHGLSPVHWQARHDPTPVLWDVRCGTGHGSSIRRRGKE